MQLGMTITRNNTFIFMLVYVYATAGRRNILMKEKLSNTQEDRTSLEMAWYPVVAGNDQSTRVSKTAKYGQHVYSRLLTPHLCTLLIG